MKTYLSRVYKAGVLVQTWGGSSKAPVPLGQDVTFSDEIDGGLSPLTLSPLLPFDHDGEDVTLGNVVETFCIEDGVETLVHAGFLETVQQELSDGADSTSVTVTPYVKQLSSDIFRDDVSGTTVSKIWTTTDVSTILAYIVNKSIIRAGVFSRVHTSAASMPLSGKTISIQVGGESYLDAIRRVKALGPGNWYWHVDASGLFSYRNFDSGTQHRFTLGREVTRLSLTRDAQELRNTVYFWNGSDATGTVLALERSDAGSQATYGRRVELLTDTRIDDADTAKSLADAYVREHGQPMQTLTVEIEATNGTKGYPIETLHPGDTCQLVNLPSISGITYSIIRVDYTPDGATLTLANGPVQRPWSLGKTVEEMYQYIKTFSDGSIPTATNA